MRVRGVAICVILVGAGALPAAGAESELDAKAAKLFKVRWSSVRYDKSVEVQNPDAAKSGTKQPVTENLTLSLEVEIRDPNLVLGTARDGAITEIIDGKDQDVAVGAPAVPSMRRLRPMMYEGLRYVPTFRRPTVPKWRQVIRWILRRPSGTSGPPQMVQELQPNQVSMRLDMGLLSQAGGDLKCVKGYFNALVAGSMEHVDVPFEPNNAWVRLTPDVEIRVKNAVATTGSYQFEIEMRPERSNPMQLLMSGQPLPARMVVKREIIGEDGKPDSHNLGGPALMAPIAGRGFVSGRRLGKVKAIRFLIAVNPADYRVPFEVRNIPLPNPNP